MDVHVSKKLFDLFQGFSGREFIFGESGGNYGDCLIYQGAYKLAKSANLKFKRLSFAECLENTFNDNDIVYIHGGGGFVPWWSGKVMTMTKKLSQEFKGTLILGPTSFWEDIEYLKSALNDCLGGNHFKKLFIFVRDHRSYSILEKCLPCQAQIICDHDTSLNLVRSDLIAGNKRLDKYDLYAIRHDRERPAGQFYNYFSWLDPIDVSSSFDEWVDFHARAKKLVTNRTHSTILGSILGVPTVMLPNNYHKNRSIWEFSLRDRGVQWSDKIDCFSLNRVIEANPMLRHVFTSYKYRKILKLRLKYLGV
jgi:exopolysaccharide biosynthesis predicted pyruvyltransferase EpsI